MNALEFADLQRVIDNKSANPDARAAAYVRQDEILAQEGVDTVTVIDVHGPNGRVVHFYPGIDLDSLI